MSTLARAIELAVQAHRKQKDREGQPYILHPLRVMFRCKDEVARIVAVLHDTVEDTDLTFDDLVREGFGEEVLGPLRLLTHDGPESYAGYVVRLAQSPVARQVKLADLEDNSMLERASLSTDPKKIVHDFRRTHRYLLTAKFLRDELTEEQYRALMAEHGEKLPRSRET